jgi:hypothetical protein
LPTIRKRSVKKTIGGAVLMGLGGIMAGGCTIGQGITAGSMLALSWSLAVGGMMLGSRLGIAVLVDGSPADIIHRGGRNSAAGSIRRNEASD